MANLQGVVVDDKNAPVHGATVTLIGTPIALTQVTNMEGKFRFENLLPGAYQVSALLKGYIPAPLSAVNIIDGQDTEASIKLSVETGNGTASLSPLRKPIVQNTTLTVIGLVFAAFLYKGIGGVDTIQMTDDSAMRGMISYLVTFGTIMISMLLVLSAILSNGGAEMKERFSMGKEIFTTLIGVLGTIMGFYYGSTVVKGPSPPPSNIQMATVKITPDQPRAGTSVNFNSLVTGGEKPYLYSIKFYKDVIQPIVNQPSNDGKISQDISIPENVPPGDISFQIEVKDKKGDIYTYNKDGQQKLNLQKAATPIPTPTP